MITVQKATEVHVEGIADVCTAAQWDTYSDLCDDAYIQRVCDEFYNHHRILDEIKNTSKEWGGWFVALENRQVIGAIGGGMTGEETGEIFVLYLDPSRRNEGIGTRLLTVVTEQQKKLGAKQQWVSIQKENHKGIPFYEARGFKYQHEQKTYQSKEDEDYTSLRYRREL
ncbi:GNAT family N-acetyltransferase [Salipaludibacillus daqingensis]|uniref:GNAT family N-acetyltransferase n=1 Tax=Salipaludibacillus daqingensis TaxID=3041001 RepID=UPI0024730025|nr:GNAT family N-acetyltransferase [Salipaludibacillus daqingensis]